MRAFVTGATGLLGGSLVEALLAAGHSVTAMVRSKAKAGHLAAQGVSLVEGDMEQVGGFAPALGGHEVLFHAAAYFREYYQPGDHWAKLKAINVDGTAALLRAAEAAGVGKVVYASSSGVLGKAPGGAPADETTPPDAMVHRNLYFRSKLLAERAVDAFLAESRLPVVLIQPGWMFGPGDRAPTSSGRLILDYLNRRLPVSFPGYGAATDARDVARAMLAAAERGRGGERYLVSADTPVRFDQLFALLEELSGVPAPRLSVPYGVVLAAAYASEALSRLSGQPATMPVEGIRTLREPHPTSSAKGARELGATFRPLRETLRDELAWFARHRPELVGPAAGRLAALGSA
ncbi:MAG TPA: NAD-dependent epimerase/dehydratase family protein [Chloroflexaceae bacterium]|nr:NAD-dependent epimerase/dehydratase family protein [Chloroflexaceae bacterium]